MVRFSLHRRRNDRYPRMKRARAWTIYTLSGILGLWIILVPIARHLGIRSHVNAAVFGRIELGMTETELTRMLGGPEGDYALYTEAYARVIRGSEDPFSAHNRRLT